VLLGDVLSVVYVGNPFNPEYQDGSNNGGHVIGKQVAPEYGIKA